MFQQFVRGLLLIALVILLPVLSGCEGKISRSASGNRDSGADADSDSDSDGDGDSDSDGDGDSDSDGGPPDDGCAKVDFLFVIDNSISMHAEQETLIGSFPGFIQAIKDTLRATNDYHIMVVDTDSFGKCTAKTCSNVFSACVENGLDEHICDIYESLDPCDLSWGAGVLHPAGREASNRLCEVYGGNRYIIEDEPDLEQAFACIAQVGLSGHPKERPIDAMVAALSEKQNGPGGCNENFVRDDAILVATFVTNDPQTEDETAPGDWDADFGPSDTVEDWYNALLEAKGGNSEAIVLLGLIPTGTTISGEECGNGASGLHWQALIDLFGDHGLSGPVCEDEYVSFFEKAVSLIDNACDEFVE